MKIAIPVSNGALSLHFGHCDTFEVFDVDKDTKTISGPVSLTPPPHEPGVLPKWLSEQGADIIVSGGMGMRAQQLFTQAGVEVITGASAEDPKSIVEKWMNGTLEVGSNVCDH